MKSPVFSLILDLQPAPEITFKIFTQNPASTVKIQTLTPRRRTAETGRTLKREQDDSYEEN